MFYEIHWFSRVNDSGKVRIYLKINSFLDRADLELGIEQEYISSSIVCFEVCNKQEAFGGF